MRFRALAALAVLGIAACNAARALPTGRRDPGTLVVAEAADVIALDPVRVTDSESLEITELVFEGLVGWKPGTTDVEPRLASSWQVAPDGRTWTFHLRDHVQFHDGTPLDASAVVFSFERTLDPKHPYFLVGGDTYWRSLLKDVERVTAIDPRTVEIRTRRPYSPLLGELAIFPIVSPSAVARWGAGFAFHPIGTGPYSFEEWDRGEQVVLRRFDDYWGPRPDLERIVFVVIVDARQRLVGLESGSVDLATAILPDEQPFVELHPDLVLHHTPGNDISYLAFNTMHPPFDDVRVRRAANLAINKEPIIKLGYQGRAIAADGPLPPTLWGYHAAAQRYAYDPAAAKKLLAEAAADGTFDPHAVFKLYAPSTPRPYLPQPERVARFLQAGLEQVGIHTELVLQPYAQDRDALERGDHDLGLFGWIGDTGDPDNFLYVLFDPENAEPGTARNLAFFKNAELHGILSWAQETTDRPQREQYYKRAQDLIAREAPWVPLAHAEVVVAARASLAGVVVHPSSSIYFQRVWRR